jgi:single-strand selective monofunctional uracil DNA glycosylase
MNIGSIIDQQIKALEKLNFSPPVTHVYNPLKYARKSHDLYWRFYGKPAKEIVFLGMNPGPWGMVQTGVPFGEIKAVKEWMNIKAGVDTPKKMHPKRPVEGFSCTRSEVSGRRLWGWAQTRFKTPEKFFSRFFVANYCPLVFMEESGKNRTPDKLKKEEKASLFDICDLALCELVRYLKPKYVIGVGAFAEKQAKSALKGMDIHIGRITHPSPANPRANKGWEKLVEKELSELGINK